MTIPWIQKLKEAAGGGLDPRAQLNIYEKDPRSLTIRCQSNTRRLRFSLWEHALRTPADTTHRLSRTSALCKLVGKFRLPRVSAVKFTFGLPR